MVMVMMWGLMSSDVGLALEPELSEAVLSPQPPSRCPCSCHKVAACCASDVLGSLLLVLATRATCR